MGGIAIRHEERGRHAPSNRAGRLRIWTRLRNLFVHPKPRLCPPPGRNEELHRQTVALVADQLRLSGHDVTACPRLPRAAKQGDLIVDGRLRVAVRAATTHPHKHVVVSRGRKYRYIYTRSFFNFSIRGKRSHHPNVWALVQVETGRIHWLTDAESGEHQTAACLASGRLSACGGRACAECERVVLGKIAGGVA